MSLFNLPNSLTLLRILLVPVFTYFFLTEQYRIALIIFLITGFTDLIDGELARRLNKKTTLGAILDPAADKFLMTVCFIILTLRSWVPLWLTCLVIFRDLWIISGVGILKKLKRKLYFSPTRMSKLNTSMQLLTILVSLTVALLTTEKPPAFEPYLPWLVQALRACVYATAAMTIFTLIQYTRIGTMLLMGRRDYADLPVKENKTGLQ